MRRSGFVGTITALALVAVACSGQPPRGEDAAAGAPSPGPSDLVQGSLGATPSGSVLPSASPGAASGGGGSAPGGSGPGSGGGAKPPVITTGSGGVPEANLYSGAAVTQGITAEEIRLCAHAGLSLATVFGNDINQLEKTYWRMVNEEMGGVYGRTVNFEFFDDGYSPLTTPNAFNECRDHDPFFMIGGIGFDQTPTYRGLAEQNKELYIHGMATESSSIPLKYSFAAAPTVEYLGRLFARAMTSRLPGKKVGILTVSSAGWKGGAESFKDEIGKLGYKDADKILTREISNNNEVLTSHVQAFKGAGVQAVFLNVNVLAWTRFVTEADGQDFYPSMVGFGFNLLTETVGETMRSFPPSWGLSPWVVYDPQTSYSWSAEYARMKTFYAKYWNNASPNDIDWIQWSTMKAFHRLLLDCGKQCNRNKIAGLLLTGYDETESPNCNVDFGRGRFGGYLANLWKSQNRGTTQYWKQLVTCKANF